MTKAVLGIALYLFAAAAAPDPAASLRVRLDRVFADTRLATANLGVLVRSLDRPETLYEKNSSKLFVPASTNKILTAAAAFVRLGAAYRFPTRVYRDGPVEGGVLRGNLIIAGSGDPSAAPRFYSGDPFSVFRQWAATLKAFGIRRVAGDVRADPAAWADQKFGNGWQWDDLAEPYAAPPSPLEFNENMLSLEIAAGARPGDPAIIRQAPMDKFLDLEGRVITSEPGTAARIEVDRADAQGTMKVSGAIPKGTATTRDVAVPDPTRYFLAALRRTLSDEGIGIDAGIVPDQRPELLFVHSSPELVEITRALLKLSINPIAETLARALGPDGTFAGGKAVLEQTLEPMGVEKGSYGYADGSGLSRLDLVSPRTLVSVLGYMKSRPDFPLFYDALPSAGVDGTLAERMKGTRAEGNVHAKTGTLTGVSAIAGYVRTADGEMLAFSIMVNNYLASKEAAEAVEDRALQVLANFSRK